MKQIEASSFLADIKVLETDGFAKCNIIENDETCRGKFIAKKSTNKLSSAIVVVVC